MEAELKENEQNKSERDLTKCGKKKTRTRQNKDGRGGSGDREVWGERD